MEYWNKDLGDHGDNQRVKGTGVGPIIVPAGQVVTSIPVGVLIPLTTDPTPLPATPLEDRKWIKFKNEDLVDVELCDGEGNVIETIEPSQWANDGKAYLAGADIPFHGKVAFGTADIGIRVIEGK